MTQYEARAVSKWASEGDYLSAITVLALHWPTYSFAGRPILRSQIAKMSIAYPTMSFTALPQPHPTNVSFPALQV